MPALARSSRTKEGPAFSVRASILRISLTVTLRFLQFAVTRGSKLLRFTAAVEPPVCADWRDSAVRNDE